MEGKNFVFIGGLHRSGTSLLHELLRSHPEVSGFRKTGMPKDEGQHLQTVYPAAKVFGGPGRFGFDARSFMDESHPLVSKVNAERLYSQWANYWDTTKHVLIEKSPPNLVRTRFLQALFPNSCFILILRHPIAVSYATMKWSKTSVKSILEHTLICYERILQDLPYLNKVYVLRYEDLVMNPTKSFLDILEFIGLPPASIATEVHQYINEKYFRMWLQDSKGVFRGLPLRDVASRYEHRARALGYSLALAERDISPIRRCGYRVLLLAYRLLRRSRTQGAG
jgi:hypothetical protein